MMANKRICILGSGLVSSAVVNFFCRDFECDYTYAISVGSIIASELERLKNKYPRIRAVLLDVTKDEEKLRELILSADIIISLLTNDMQEPIAKLCIKLRKNMVHASYCTKGLMSLDSEAKENGVTILNELGLDPGIDHLLAMKAIDEIKTDGQCKITAFISYCGGLPEPQASYSNPLRYKFSWSPLTSLRNLLNSATYLKNNEIIHIPSGGALIDTIQRTDDDFQDDRIQLEAYPNRDSLIYKDLYGLADTNTIIRGTYRYSGFQKIIKALFKLGLFSQEPAQLLKDDNENWAQLIVNLLSNNEENSGYIHELLSLRGFDKTEIDMLDQLGILSRETPLHMHSSLLETLAGYLTGKLKYEHSERDMVIMRHEIRFEKRNDKGKCEKLQREITFLAYGEQDKDGFSAMSKTVALTIGHASVLLLNGMIQRKGVIFPFTADIYEPILEKLNEEGLVFKENTVTSV